MCWNLGNDGTVLSNNGSSNVLKTPQMSMKKGLQVFGDHGLKAVKSEMQQLHYWKVMKPVE